MKLCDIVFGSLLSFRAGSGYGHTTMPLRPEPLTLTGWSLETGPPPVNAPLGHGKKTLGIPRQGRSGWLYYQCFRCEQHQKNRAGAPEFLMKGHSVFGVAWTVTGPWSSLGGRERTLPARLACITARPFLQGPWFSTGQLPPSRALKPSLLLPERI